MRVIVKAYSSAALKKCHLHMHDRTQTPPPYLLPPDVSPPLHQPHRVPQHLWYSDSPSSSVCGRWTYPASLRGRRRAPGRRLCTRGELSCLGQSLHRQQSCSLGRKKRKSDERSGLGIKAAFKIMQVSLYTNTANIIFSKLLPQSWKNTIVFLYAVALQSPFSGTRTCSSMALYTSMNTWFSPWSWNYLYLKILQ